MARGHWCRICGRRRPNEAFSGRGHRDCICRDCQKLPKSERERVDVTRELFGYVEQSRISEKNLRRLAELAGHEDPEIREHAAALLDIARVYPGKRKRWARLARSHPALFRRYREAIGVWDEADVYDVFGDEALEVLCAGEGLVGSDVPGGTGDGPDIPF
jgi:hypothetical protein